MTDPTETSVIATDDDWLTAPPEQVESGPADAPSSGRFGRGMLGRTGLLVAGAAAGALVVATVNHGSGSGSGATASLPAGVQNVLPGQTGGQPGGAPPAFGGGGRAGEQHISGTLTAVGASTVTVRSAAGSATYVVTPATEIVRDGAAATLSQLSVGDTVFVHVYPTSAGGALAVERLFAGESAGGDPGRGDTPSGTET